MIAFIKSVLGFGSTESEQELGPEAIARAYNEVRSDYDVSVAQVGEPKLGNYNGEFDRDVKVEVPLLTAKYSDPTPITFDIESDRLDAFLDEFGIESIEAIGELEGATIEIEWENGTPIPQW